MDSNTVLSCIKDDIRGVSYGRFPGLTEEENLQCAALAKQLLVAKVFSKLRPQAGCNAVADDAAIAKFRDVNNRSCQFDIGQRRTFEWEEELFGTFVQRVRKFFLPHEERPILLGLEQFLHSGSLGSGSNLGALGTDFYTKLFSSDLGVTSVSLYDAYRTWTRRSPTWRDAEDTRVELGYGTAMYDASRMTTVPKNDAISRVIGVEPSLNMFYQLGLGSVLRKRLKSAFGIDISNQADKNRELARKGSIDDSNVTIDLESASDSVSLSLVKHVVPKGQYAFLEMLRTDHAALPSGERVRLGMLSMMGNGFTFPFQTMIFSCMVSASFEYLGYGTPRADDGGWGVFGDDIVCPRTVSRAVLRLLDICGFVINESKTFVEGPFRESCGGDYYLGHNIRPVYIKQLATQEARFTVINQLVEWSAKTGIPLFKALRLIQTRTKWNPVPIHAGHDAGIRVPINLATGLRRSRNGSYIATFHEARGRKLLVEENTVGAPRGEKPRRYNASGLLLTALQGGWSKGGIGIRSDTLRYRHRQVVCPNWHAAYDFPSGMDGWQHWIDAATAVLTPR